MITRQKSDISRRIFITGLLCLLIGGTLSMPVEAAKISAVGLAADPPAPQLPGTTILLTATPTDGERVEYRFFSSISGASWVTMQTYSANNTCTWIPPEQGIYTVMVWAREVGSANQKDVYKTLRYAVTDAKPLSAVALAAAPVAPQKINTAITLTATPTDGIEVEYRFFVAAGDTWTTIRPYGKSNTCKWTPTAEGTYQVMVWAREVGSANQKDAYQTTSYQIVNPPPLTAVDLTTDLPSAQRSNTPITLTATATGGFNNQYRFFIYDGSAWVTLQSYGNMNTYSWTPANEGDYQLMVWARETGSPNGKDAYKVISYRIFNAPPLTAVTLAAGPPSPHIIGTPVTLTATPVGGLHPQYRFFVSDGAAWTTIQSYSNAKTCSWTPDAVGRYTLMVWTREMGSSNQKDVYATINYGVITADGLQGVTLSADLPSPQRVGTEVTLTAVPTGGANVEYKFLAGYDDGSATVWTTLRGYSTVNTCTRAQDLPREYTLGVWAREVDGTFPYDVSAEIPFSIVTPSSVTIAITPAKANVMPGSNRNFTATVTGTANTAVTWRVKEGETGGSITPAGVYTAPTAQGTYHVIATSVADPTAWVSSEVTVAPSAGGKIAYTSRRYGNPEVFIMNPDGSGQTRVTNTTAWQDEISISPDGSKIMYISDRNKNWDLYVINVDGTNERRLTTSPRNDWRGKYSPDGSKIIFFRTLDGKDEIFLMNANGGGEQQMTNNREGSILPQYTPDGKNIVYCTYKNGNWDVYIMNADFTNPRPIVTLSNYDYYPDISPDGTKIVWCAWERIGIVNIDGTNKQPLTNPPAGKRDYHPCFSPDGQYIAFASNRTGNEDIYVMKVDGSDLRNITNTPWDEWFPSWGPEYP